MPIIFKSLPNGKTVSRTVTAQEYINDGWATQGWAAPPQLQQQAEKIQERDITNQLRQKSNDELKALARKWTIAKKLPNGRWVTRKVYGGEFENEGWAQQGWIIPSFSHFSNRRLASNSEKATDWFIRRIKATQNWWRPKRSIDQARSYYAPMTKVIQNQLGHNANDDIAKIQTGLYNPNPNWRKWLRKGHNWMEHNYRSLYRQTVQGTPQQKARARIALFRSYNNRVRAPPKVTPVYKDKVLGTNNYRWRNWGRLN